jgi:hypothetical protein
MSELNENWSRRNNKFIPSRHLATAADADNDNRCPENECELNGDNDLGGESIPLQEDLFQVILCFNLFTNYPKKLELQKLRFKLSTFFC